MTWGIQPARTPVEVDRRIQVWHDMPEEEYERLDRPSLNEYLGWHEDDYADWMLTGKIPN